MLHNACPSKSTIKVVKTTVLLHADFPLSLVVTEATVDAVVAPLPVPVLVDEADGFPVVVDVCSGCGPPLTVIRKVRICCGSSVMLVRSTKPRYVRPLRKTSHHKQSIAK